MFRKRKISSIRPSGKRLKNAQYSGNIGELSRVFGLIKLIVPIIVILVIWGIFGRVLRLSGRDLEPNLHSGTLIWMSRGTYPKEVGQVVVIDYQDKWYIRRVIGLPNSKYSYGLKRGRLLINGRLANIQRSTHQPIGGLTDSIHPILPIDLKKTDQVAWVEQLPNEQQLPIFLPSNVVLWSGDIEEKILDTNQLFVLCDWRDRCFQAHEKTFGIINQSQVVGIVTHQL